MTNLDVVTIGESMVQLTPPETGLLRHAAQFDRFVAGAASNVAIGLVRMGHRAGWISRVGGDEFGACVRASIRGTGVDTTHVVEDEAARRVRETGLIAIIRGDYSRSQLRSLAEALQEGGVDVVEITLNSTDALDGITALRQHVDDSVLVGAGTVWTGRDVEQALDAGAQFLVSPNFDPESVARSREAGVLHVPGVCTASEAQQAFAAGCPMQKLFPATHLGPSYLSALRGPLDDVSFVPTGGITADRIPPFVDAGAVAFGVGSALVTGPDQPRSDVRSRAQDLVTALNDARAP
jgi:2-dehydro-3-deoxyphosphogluconate aldolase/(4S)-4-hydroxy-2-oxoglutarate aldolase